MSFAHAGFEVDDIADFFGVVLPFLNDSLENFTLVDVRRDWVPFVVWLGLPLH